MIIYQIRLVLGTPYIKMLNAEKILQKSEKNFNEFYEICFEEDYLELFVVTQIYIGILQLAEFDMIFFALDLGK